MHGWRLVQYAVYFAAPDAAGRPARPVHGAMSTTGKAGAAPEICWVRSSGASTASAGIRADEEMTWKRYALGLLAFNFAGAARASTCYCAFRDQLPLNPLALPAVRPEDRLQHGGELHDQHELAGLRRRDRP